jgi:photosystem II stability/assembly factor-like uncharacterized protein
MKYILPRFCTLQCTFALILLLTSLAPIFAGPDLDVAYISRTPMYYKYNVSYQNGLDPLDWGVGKPYLTASEQAKRRWPVSGEVVTFTAVIKNPGNAPTGSFNYKWYMDGVEVGSGTLASIPVGGQVSTTYNWTWDSEWNDHYIKFVADPSNLISENIETNNSREDRTNSISFRLHVWQSVYDWFHDNAPSYNSNIVSFDDWAQMQIGYINKMFKEAVWPVSPSGILERARLDEVVVEPNDTVDPDPYACHAPDDFNWDCRWGFTPTEYPQIFIENPGFVSGPYMWVLHEWGHQMGLIDVYRFFFDKSQNNIRPTFGHNPTRVDDLMVSTGVLQYSDATAAALNSNLHKRKGYFGEYLYDVPRTCRIRILDAYHRPIPNAAFKLYQDNCYIVQEPPTFVGTTDAQGYYTLPNRTCYGETTTGTGHILHDNPWSLIYVVGFNGIFYCEVTASGQTDYQYMEIMPFNVAYRAGHTDTYTYNLQTTIMPGGRVTPRDLYGVKMVSGSLGYTVGAGGKILKWNGSTWSDMTSPTTQTLRAVDAYSATGLACAVGDGGTVLVCSGGTWAKKTISTTTNLKACAFLSANTIFIGGDNGQLYKSTNGGSTWSSVLTTSYGIRSIKFFDSGRGVLVCDGGRIFYTIKGGSVWGAGSGSFGGCSFTDCAMTSGNEAWACSNNGKIFRSKDSGMNWTLMWDYGQSMYGMDLKQGGDGWSAGGMDTGLGAVPIKRYVGGKYMNEAMTPNGPTDTIYDISCVSGDDAWAVGAGGLILHLVNSDVSGYYHGTAAEIQQKPNGSAVVMTGSAVTASFPGEVYVESTNRSTGFKVLTTQSIAPGTLVQVTGVLDTVGLERVIRYGDLVSVGSASIKPVGLNTKVLTGTSVDKGLSSIPRLVRICGKVTARDEVDGSFTVNDGSGKLDADGNKGVKVIVVGKTPPSINAMVMVTGISSYETILDQTYPLIKARGANDVQP